MQKVKVKCSQVKPGDHFYDALDGDQHLVALDVGNFKNILNCKFEMGPWELVGIDAKTGKVELFDDKPLRPGCVEHDIYILVESKPKEEKTVDKVLTRVKASQVKPGDKFFDKADSLNKEYVAIDVNDCENLWDIELDKDYWCLYAIELENGQACMFDDGEPVNGEDEADLWMFLTPQPAREFEGGSTIKNIKSGELFYVMTGGILVDKNGDTYTPYSWELYTFHKQGLT